MSNVINCKDLFEELQAMTNVERCRRTAEKMLKKQDEHWDEFRQSMFDTHIRPLFDPESAA